MNFKRFNPEQTFTNAVAFAKSLRQQIEQTPCPSCKQKTLRLGNYTRTPKEWGAAISCINCNFSGEVNSTGFSFSKVDSKGKAKE